MRRVFAGLLSAYLAEPSLALGREVSYAEASSHFASLQQLLPCGTWQQGEQSGDLRLLRFSLYGQDLLFIDKLRSNADGTGLEVERGFGFAEINNDHAELMLSELRCQSDGNHQISLQGLVESGHDQSRWRIRIELDSRDGRYRYEAKPSE